MKKSVFNICLFSMAISANAQQINNCNINKDDFVYDKDYGILNMSFINRNFPGFTIQNDLLESYIVNQLKVKKEQIKITSSFTNYLVQIKNISSNKICDLYDKKKNIDAVLSNSYNSHLGIYQESNEVLSTDLASNTFILSKFSVYNTQTSSGVDLSNMFYLNNNESTVMQKITVTLKKYLNNENKITVYKFDVPYKESQELNCGIYKLKINNTLNE